MANDRLHHDVAYAAAQVCIELVAPSLPSSERKAAFGAFYETVKAALAKYDAIRELEGARLRPSKN